MAHDRIYPGRAGFTLIEVVLAIGLSTALLALLTWAFNSYLLRVDSSRAAVENAQLARGVLRLMATDLRAAATLFEQDTSQVEELAATQAQFDVDELDEIGEDEEVDPADTRRPVGLYGAAGEFSLDVNRARAVDPTIEYGSGQTQSPSATLTGVTTVRYFVTAEGLARQEAPRDVDVYESGGGVSETLAASTRVIAPEVAGLSLIYSDGEQAADVWDSEQEDGALPAAVELLLTLKQAANEGADGGDDAAAEEPVYRTYRLVVALPATPPAAAPLEEGAL
ncbi:MAG: hypothetical protein AAGB00_05830 [Planctomycetota bacterium]